MAKKTKGWLDNYGEEANANEGSSSASKEWIGEGYSNVGRNYSPAWGGQFAMGGSIPGSVGFTYARTNSPAPSEGPYAKKTLPSAQNGQEMRYYQEGLDWKPRNISRDGSITKAQKGEKVIIDGKEYDTASEEYKDLYRWGPNDDGRGSIGYFDKNGVLVTNKMTLPEVVVYPKSKSTKQFYEDDLTDGEQYVFDQFAKKYGPVNIEKNEGSGIFSETAGHYNPITNTITINPKANRNSFDTYVAELAHKVQFDKQGKFDVIGDWIFNDLPAYAKRSYYNIIGDRYKAAEASPYEIPGTVENEAHSIYEPKLVDEAIDYYQEDVFGNTYNKYKTGGWLNKYVPEAQNGLFIPGVTDFVMPRAASDNTRVSQRDYELEREIALRNKMADQPQLKQDRKQTIAEKKESVRKKKQYVSSKPNTELNDQDEIVQTNPDRGFDGQPLTPNAKRFDKGLGHIMDAIETTGAITGLGSVGTNLLRLGAGALETKIGRNILSRNLKNFTSRVTPTINAIDDASAYVQMDPIGIMGNRVNSQFYNPTVALNTANNTLTGVERNLKNSAVESADLIAGDNNLRNLTGSSVENVTLPKITPEQWKDMSGYLGRRQFVKGLQKEGLVGKEFNLGDVNYAARSTEKTDALTKLALDRYRTGYRGVQGDVGTGIGTQNNTNITFDMNRPAYGNTISEVDNMIKAGVDFQDPLSIARYQATHIPMETYGYRSGIPRMYKADALYTTDFPNEYGKYQFRIKRPTDFSQGNYENWFNKYYKEQPKFEGDVWQGLVNSNDVPSETINYGKNIWIDAKGKKVANVDESFPFTNHKNLTPEQEILYKKYQDDLIKNFNTGWRGQYKKGGVVKDNNGYWNPDNWGEVVEIDSPYITMQGVNQPLLGISDTGDVQYMEPGQDYEFDGSKVREYPIPTAQTGTRKPIYTDDPRKVKAYQDSVRLNEKYPFMEAVNKVGSSSPGDMFMLKSLHPEYFANKKNQPIAVAVTSDHNIYEYKNQSPSDVSRGKAQKQVLGPMHLKPVQPYILKEEPKLKGRVSQVEKLPMGEPSQKIGITQRQMPNIIAPDVEMSGPYMAGYHDYDTQEGIDRGFRTAEERDAFVKELNNRPAGNYQPGLMNVSSYYDISKRKTKKVNQKETGGWLSQYK